MKTGNTASDWVGDGDGDQPQWSPVMKTGNTARRWRAADRKIEASMEPGHEDREYICVQDTFQQ